MKKTISTFIIACLVFSAAVPALLSGAAPVGQGYLTAYWPGFRGAEDFKGLTDAKTPVSASETGVKWNYSTGGSWTNAPGAPLEIGDFVYFASGKKIVKLNKETGDKVAESTEAVDSVLFFSTIAYGDGKFFMPVNGGRVQAFDAETLKSVWVSQVCALSGMQSLSPVTYHDGYIYMGITNGQATSGMFFCLSTADDDPGRSDEIKSYTWVHEPGSTGFYWSEGVPVGDSIIFAGENGVLVSHHLKSNIITDTLTLAKNNGSNVESVRSSVHYDKGTKRVYVSTKAGSVHSVKINADGTFDLSSYKSKFIANDLTSSPATYNGRLYIGGGGVSSAAPFSVLNAETLEIIYQIPELLSQSSPIISTAYASDQNNGKVYIYLLRYKGTISNPDRIYCVEDGAGQTTANYTELAQSPNGQYNSSSLSAGRDGTLYYKNDTGRVFAFGSVNGQYTSADVVNAIDRLPAPDKLTAADEALLKLTEERYYALPESEKAAVTNPASLSAARERMDEISDTAMIVSKLIADIAALPTVELLTLADNASVQSLLESYYALADSDRQSVTNSDKLMAAKAKIEELADIRKVTYVQTKIAALPVTVTMAAKTAIENALAAYNDLSADLRSGVSNAAVLQMLAAQLNALVAEIDAINGAIWALNPRNITLADKAAIEDIISRYNRLSEGDRAYAEYFYEVLEFKAVIDGLEAVPNTGESENTVPRICVSVLSLLLIFMTVRRRKRGRA